LLFAWGLFTFKEYQQGVILQDSKMSELENLETQQELHDNDDFAMLEQIFTKHSNKLGEDVRQWWKDQLKKS